MLRRAADGRLRPAGEERDIADIWAEQKRLRLKRAIEDDNRRRARQADKRLRREQRKKLGWRAGRQSGKSAGMGAPGSSVEQGTAKDIEIRFSLPHLRRISWDDVEDFLANLDIPELRRAHAVYAACVLTCVALACAAPLAFRSTGHQAPTPAATHSGITAPSTGPRIDNPPYATILPKGKTIAQLGGWGRVSPKSSDPVYAFADTINGIQINISEQPLPDAFTLDPTTHVTELAKQFNATKPLVAGTGATAFIGSSPQGVQSVVATKQELLILVRSVGVIPDAAWGSYLESLQ